MHEIKKYIKNYNFKIWLFYISIRKSRRKTFLKGCITEINAIL